MSPCRALLPVAVLALAGSLLTPAAASALPPVAALARSAAQPRPVPPEIQQRPLGAPDAKVAPRGVEGLARVAPGAVVVHQRIDDLDPFELLGVTWAEPVGGAVTVAARVREAGGWTAWSVLDVVAAAPAPGTAEARRARAGSEPLLTGRADAAEVRVTSPEQLPDLRLDLVDPGSSLADEAITGGPKDASSTTSAASAASAPVSSGRPAMVTRAQWGADESRRSDVGYSQSLKAMVVHHTATTNSYSSSAEAAREIRAVYAYHTGSQGWSDIGYNFVVDRFGTVFEGRAGSIDRLVIGAHTGGFNTDTMGVAALGTYSTTSASSAQQSAIAQVIAWKLGQYGVDPTGWATLTSAGGGISRYPDGRQVTVAAVSGHRTFGYTECPGDALAARLGSIASTAQRLVDAAPPQVGAVPLVGDWDADGRDDVGWFRDGAWALRRSNGTVLRFGFGSKGDIPVIADWDGNGRDDIGVFRRGMWHQRGSLSTGPAFRVVGFGIAGDLPVVGRWPGSAGPSLGVVRGQTWHLARDLIGNGARQGVGLGVIGDVPLVGDWDGNGTDTPGVAREPNLHYLANVLGPNAQVVLRLGSPDDVPVSGDWDGDGRGTTGVVRGPTWLWRDDHAGGNATGSLRFDG